MYIPIDNSDKSLNFWDKIKRAWVRERKRKECDCEKEKKKSSEHPHSSEVKGQFRKNREIL